MGSALGENRGKMSPHSTQISPTPIDQACDGHACNPVSSTSHRFSGGADPFRLTHRFAAIGPYLEVRTTIRFTELVEQEFGGFRSPPIYVDS
jgi:hypothetical protein